MIVIQTREELAAIQKPKNGDLVKILLEEPEYYVYQDGKWIQQTAKIEMSLYEINKQLYLKEPNLTNDQIKSKLKSYIYDNNFITNNNKEYCMLLCNELNYYTIFDLGHGKDYNSLLDELTDVVSHFDNVKHIEQVKGGLEIWATLHDQFVLFMFFDYTQGVIKCQ